MWGGGQPHDLPPDCQWERLGLAGWLPICDSGLGPSEVSEQGCLPTCELLASPMGPGPVPGCGRASPGGPALLGLWVAQAVRFLSEDLLCDKQGAATVPGICCLLGTTSRILILRWSVPAEGPVQCGTLGARTSTPGVGGRTDQVSAHGPWGRQWASQGTEAWYPHEFEAQLHLFEPGLPSFSAWTVLAPCSPS